MPITIEEKLNGRLRHAVHHREQLDAITADMCLLLALKPETVAGQTLKSAVYGAITLNEALIRVVNLKLAELATIQVEGIQNDV